MLNTNKLMTILSLSNDIHKTWGGVSTTEYNTLIRYAIDKHCKSGYAVDETDQNTLLNLIILLTPLITTSMFWTRGDVDEGLTTYYQDNDGAVSGVVMELGTDGVDGNLVELIAYHPTEGEVYTFNDRPIEDGYIDTKYSADKKVWVSRLTTSIVGDLRMLLGNIAGGPHGQLKITAIDDRIRMEVQLELNSKLHEPTIVGLVVSLNTKLYQVSPLNLSSAHMALL